MSASFWTKPLAKWFARGAETVPGPPSVLPAETAPADAPPRADDDAAQLAALQPHFLHWLLGLAPSDKPVDAVAADDYSRSLAPQLDAVIASDAQVANLLPRAAQVVPQLMKSMRDERYSAVDVAARIAKDVVLTTEIIRLANNVHRAGKEPIVDVAHAVTAVGSDGLRRAIAKVVLRPVFEARTAPLSINAAPHIWTDADRKARLAAALAPSHGVDAMDAYLAGLLHNTGWTALLRALDGLRPPPRGKTLLNAALGRELVERRDRLFSRLVGPWDLSPALTALAREMGERGLASAGSPLAEVLRRAESLATRHALRRSHDLPGGAAAVDAGLPEAVRDCLATIDKA